MRVYERKRKKRRKERRKKDEDDGIWDGEEVEVLPQALEYYERALSYWEEFSKDDEEVAAMTFAIGTVSMCVRLPVSNAPQSISSNLFPSLSLVTFDC